MNNYAFEVVPMSNHRFNRPRPINPYKYRLAYCTIVAIEVWDHVPTDDEQLLGDVYDLLAGGYGLAQVVASPTHYPEDAREYVEAKADALLRLAMRVRDAVGPNRF